MIAFDESDRIESYRESPGVKGRFSEEKKTDDSIRLEEVDPSAFMFPDKNKE